MLFSMQEPPCPRAVASHWAKLSKPHQPGPLKPERRHHGRFWAVATVMSAAMMAARAPSPINERPIKTRMVEPPDVPRSEHPSVAHVPDGEAVPTSPGHALL